LLWLARNQAYLKKKEANQRGSHCPVLIR
jgi:hypothetical protein